MSPMVAVKRWKQPLARDTRRASHFPFATAMLDLTALFVDDMEAKDDPTLEETVGNYVIGDIEHCIENIVKDREVMQHSHLHCNVQFGGVDRERALRKLGALGTRVILGVQKELARRGVTPLPAAA